MTHCERVLNLLSDGQPHTHHELYAMNVVAHSRVAELRKRGHVIACWQSQERGEKVSVYQLIAGSLDETGSERGDDGGHSSARAEPVSSSAPSAEDALPGAGGGFTGPVTPAPLSASRMAQQSLDESIREDLAEAYRSLARLQDAVPVSPDADVRRRERLAVVERQIREMEASLQGRARAAA